MTSTLNKRLLIGLLLFLFVSTASGDFYYNDGEGSISNNDSAFAVPEYDSQREIATQIVAPFLFVTLVLRIGLERALYFTLDTNNIPGTDSTAKKKANKQATVIALIIAGMMIPTPLFQSLNTVTSWVFGGAFYILLAVAFLYFIYRLITDLW